MHVISWREYTDYTQDELKDNLIKAFLEAEYFITCASNFYKLKISIPTIVINESTGNNSGICYERKAIVVKEGLLQYLFINEKNKLQATLETRTNHFLWIIAHEYSHYARRHNEVKSEIDNQYKNGDIPLYEMKIYEQVLEDDADRIATACLYRHFENYKYKNNTKLQNKVTVLNSLFEPIRLKISGVVEKNSLNNTHPVWSARLYSQVIKLAELDTRDIKIPITIESETFVQQQFLQEHLLMLERVHINAKGESEKNYLFQYLHSQNCYIDLNNLNFYSSNIYPLIYEKCCLLGLNGQTGEWVPYAFK